MAHADEAGLTADELEQERGEQLPEREAMSLIDYGSGSLPPVPVDEFAHTDPVIDGHNAA